MQFEHALHGVEWQSVLISGVVKYTNAALETDKSVLFFSIHECSNSVF